MLDASKHWRYARSKGWPSAKMTHGHGPAAFSSQCSGQVQAAFGFRGARGRDGELLSLGDDMRLTLRAAASRNAERLSFKDFKQKKDFLGERPFKHIAELLVDRAPQRRKNYLSIAVA